MLTDLQLQNFRCFDSRTIQFGPGFNFIIGPNGEGKTAILEAACVLLRLQSQRSASLIPLIKLGQKSLVVTGRYDGHHLGFRFSRLRRKIEFDHVEQRSPGEYLRIGRVVSFANADIELAAGGSEGRRRYLDFLGVQIDPRYRPALRAYERTLRSRNALLKSVQPRPREVAAYDAPLVASGLQLLAMRTRLANWLAPFATEVYREISGNLETLSLRFAPGATDNFAEDLARSREEELRLRQTVVGPHRDDLEIFVNEMPARRYASEGQQRTVALALKVGQARVLANETGAVPLLLVDDVFGELDVSRRNALLSQLPWDSQKIITATNVDWLQGKIDGPVLQLGNRASQSTSPGKPETCADLAGAF